MNSLYVLDIGFVYYWCLYYKYELVSTIYSLYDNLTTVTL